MSSAWVRLALLPLALAVAACGDDGNTNMNVPVDMAMAMEKPVDMAKKPKPDLSNPSMGPVGGQCMDETACGGTRPKCLSEITGFQYPQGVDLILKAPNGYCSDEECTSDDDCGPGGYCFPGIKLCLASCELPGDCAKLNPDTVCIPVSNAPSTCFPNPFTDSCNPTKVDACPAGKGCVRHPLARVDDFGGCVDTCKLGKDCPAGPGGVAQACYFNNTAFDAMGKPTKDKFAGLLCMPDLSKGLGAPDSACTAINGCQPNYECNIFSAGGLGQVCRRLCASNDDCVVGTCQNAFKLAKFDVGDVGLCLP